MESVTCKTNLCLAAHIIDSDSKIMINTIWYFLQLQGFSGRLSYLLDFLVAKTTRYDIIYKIIIIIVLQDVMNSSVYAYVQDLPTVNFNLFVSNSQHIRGLKKI